MRSLVNQAILLNGMPQVLVGGLSTYYEQVGQGPVLLLLHGWANTWEAWIPVIPLLSDHYTLVMPDLPGCGKTATPSVGWDTAEHAKWLEALLAKLSTLNSPLSIPAIVGHSYGGKILLEYCSGNYKPQPSKLILIDASGIPNILTGRQKLLRSLATYTPEFIKKSIGGKLRGKVYEKFGADSDYVWANEFQKKTLQLIVTEDYTEKLARIAQQTMILWGKGDTSTPLWQGESMHSLIPLNQLKVYDAGHFPHHTFPKEVSDAIIQFLQ